MHNIFQDQQISFDARDSSNNSKLLEILKADEISKDNSKDNSRSNEKESSIKNKGYQKMIKMMKSLKSENNTSEKSAIPLNSLIKSLEKQQMRENEKITMVEKIMDKLNDFQKGYQKEMIREKIEDDEEDDKNDGKDPNDLGMRIMFSENRINIRLFQERIFWSKDKIKYIRNKFRQAKILIEEKTEKDFVGIKKFIEHGDTDGVLYNIFVMILDLPC